MRIGELATLSGVSTRALRYYEENALLVSTRTSGGQRVYPEGSVERVQLLQQFFAAGLTSRTIVTLLPCVETGHTTPDIVPTLLAERSRIAETLVALTAAGEALDRMIDHAAHAGNSEASCNAAHASDQAQIRALSEARLA